ncbi:hypothetical protein [Fimbriiglobus ruber]|uniref:hypothetical protein n=1 Tax=Fimbriiglobus ruber TaxID=1908690 RepID=UPI001179AD14|nr:hypothetical protein [Fimbriiglobus ruber]
MRDKTRCSDEEERKKRRRVTARAYYLANREAVIRRTTAHRKRNPARANELKRLARKANPEGNKAAAKRWAFAARTRPHRRMARLIRFAQERAIAKGLPIDAAYLREWLRVPAEQCPCCGKPFVYELGYQPHAPSLDRIRPMNGYVKGNVDLLCRRCNTLKNDATPDELEQVADYLRRILLAAPQQQ